MDKEENRVLEENRVPYTILVIEDDKYILRILDKVLHGSGYRVITAQTGSSAFSAAVSQMPDAILLDLGLPDMDGAKLIPELRKKSQSPIIVVSARSTERDKVEALDSGADDYMVKPFSAQELLARVRAVIRRKNTTDDGSDIYKAGGLCIDFKKRLVTLEGEAVRLTNVEYRILEALARQPGKVLTYHTLLREIWGPYAENDSNHILRVNVSNIRRKIERDSLSPRYILTEIGVGYRMSDQI